MARKERLGILGLSGQGVKRGTKLLCVVVKDRILKVYLNTLNPRNSYAN